MKGLKKYCNAIIACVCVGAYYVNEHIVNLLYITKEVLFIPVVNFLLGKLWNRFTKKEKQEEIVLTPERRKRVKDDAITANDQLQKQTDIQGRIERLLGEIDGADRVIIHKFHNGGKFYGGKSTQKMALVYQASRYKYYKIDNELNGGEFNLEKTGSILKKVVDKRYLHLTMKEDKKKYEFTPYFQLLEEDGVEANHLRILRSGRDTYRNIGLLSIHFIKRKKRSINQKEIMLIDKAVRDIQLLLVDDLKGYPHNNII